MITQPDAVKHVIGSLHEGQSAAPLAPSTPKRSIVHDNAQTTSSSPAEEQHKHDQSPVSDASEQPVDAEERLARSRDRNREHARRTRLRKKQQLDTLQSRVKELQDENKLLKQTIEECSIASILLGLSSGEIMDADEDVDFKGIENVMTSTAQEKTFFTVTGKRKRFVSDADINPPPMMLKIKGKTTFVGGTNSKAQINWKTGVYLDDEGEQQQLTPDELEELRRERNRMHAKMTRDRKKLFISSIEKTIADLEEHNKRMRGILAKQALRHSGCVTPDLSPVDSDLDEIPPISAEVESPLKKQQTALDNSE
mmetsp:Transcript_27932/g.41410  ORF Transcript_27932/g.41410 Transcript_27932/m.41410 type:complete len:311 (-) Transcript_27932:292-1224(-)